MKSNILHTLIIAIILVIGWSLFTVFQDFTTPNPEGMSKISFMTKSSQYLPLAPGKTYDIKREYPSYVAQNKQVKQNSTQLSGSRNNTDFSIRDINNSSQSLSQTTSQMNEMNQATNHEMPGNRGITNAVSTPFSKSSGISQNKVLAMNSAQAGSGTSQTGGSAGGMRRVFGDDQGDDLEDGGGDENEDYYNDMPVGDGIHILLLMSLIYLIIKVRRK